MISVSAKILYQGVMENFLRSRKSQENESRKKLSPLKCSLSFRFYIFSYFQYLTHILGKNLKAGRKGLEMVCTEVIITKMST